MSGSPSGSGRGDVEVGAGFGTPSTDVCGSLDIETNLNSPVRNVVQGLKRGDELEVVLHEEPPGRTVLVAKVSSGRIAGSLTPPSLDTIVNCIENGFQYVAVVLADVDGGVIRVRVRGRR